MKKLSPITSTLLKKKLWNEPIMYGLLSRNVNGVDMSIPIETQLINLVDGLIYNINILYGDVYNDMDALIDNFLLTLDYRTISSLEPTIRYIKLHINDNNN